MKKSIFLLLIPVMVNAQTVVKRQAIALSNPAVPAYPAIPIGFTIKGNGNVVLYSSYLVTGVVKDGEKKESKGSKFLNSISGVSGGGNNADPGIPQVNENEYDAELKFVAANSKLVNYQPLDKTKTYSFNNSPISNDVTELQTIFPDFPFNVNAPATGYAALGYKGKGLFGDKDKKFFPVYGGEVLKFKNNGSADFENQNAEGNHAEENKAALEGLNPKYGNNMLFLNGTMFTAQSFFYADKDPDKYGEFKNYQFFTWDKEGNIINKEMVALPFAYDPEGVAVYNENKEAVGFLYLCRRADAGKKVLPPDENSYYILYFDAKGKLTASFETKLGEEENKVNMVSAFCNKGATYFIAQNHQKKAETITVYKVATALEKVAEFNAETPNMPKEMLLNYWTNAQCWFAKNGSFYILAQGFEKIKILGARTNTPLGIYLMAISPDFKTAATQKIDFNDPLFTLKKFSIEVLDEQEDNLYLALTDPEKHVAAAILGPKKAIGLATILSPGYGVYGQRKNYVYDAKTRSLYAISEESKKLNNGEIVKVKF